MKFEWKALAASIILTRSAKTIEVREPKPGIRHNTKTIYVHHRFPVKDGIDSAEHLYRIMTEKNPIIEMLEKEGRLYG